MNLDKQFISEEFKFFGNGQSWRNPWRWFIALCVLLPLNFVLYYLTEYWLFALIFGLLGILVVILPFASYEMQETVRGEFVGNIVIGSSFIETGKQKIPWADIKDFTFHTDGFKGEKKATLSEYIAYYPPVSNYASGLKNYVEFKYLNNTQRHYFLLESREAYELFIEVMKQQYYLGKIGTIKFRSSMGLDYADLQTHKKLKEKAMIEIAQRYDSDKNT